MTRADGGVDENSGTARTDVSCQSEQIAPARPNGFEDERRSTRISTSTWWRWKARETESERRRKERELMPMPMLRNDAGMCNNPVIARHHCRVRRSPPRERIFLHLVPSLPAPPRRFNVGSAWNGAEQTSEQVSERERYGVSGGSGSG